MHGLCSSSQIYWSRFISLTYSELFQLFNSNTNPEQSCVAESQPEPTLVSVTGDRRERPISTTPVSLLLSLSLCYFFSSDQPNLCSGPLGNVPVLPVALCHWLLLFCGAPVTLLERSQRGAVALLSGCIYTFLLWQHADLLRCNQVWQKTTAETMGLQCCIQCHVRGWIFITLGIH